MDEFVFGTFRLQDPMITSIVKQVGADKLKEEARMREKLGKMEKATKEELIIHVNKIVEELHKQVIDKLTYWHID